MSDEYPRMLYRAGKPGCEEIFGLACETAIAETAEEEQELTADGWARTPFAAHGKEAPQADPVEDQPPLDDEKLGLLDEIEQLQRQVVDLKDEAAKRDAELQSLRESFDAQGKELRDVLAREAEAQAAAKPKAKERA